MFSLGVTDPPCDPERILRGSLFDRTTFILPHEYTAMIPPAELPTDQLTDAQESVPRGNETPGDMPRDDETPGDMPRGDETPGDMPRDDETPGDMPRGDETPGDMPRDDETPGDMPRDDETPGDMPRGDETPGDMPRGDETPGDMPRGDEEFPAVWFLYEYYDTDDLRQREECTELLEIGRIDVSFSPDVIHRLDHFRHAYRQSLEANPRFSEGNLVSKVSACIRVH